MKMSNYMLVVNIGGCDIVLGAEWLRNLGPVTMDFKELYMIFVKDYHTHTIKRIQARPLKLIDSHIMEKLLKMRNSCIIS